MAALLGIGIDTRSREVIVKRKQSITNDVTKPEQVMNVDERPLFEPHMSDGWFSHPDWDRQPGSVFELKHVGWSLAVGPMCWSKPATRQRMKRVPDSNPLAIGIVREVWGHLRKTAKELGISRTTLWRKMKKYGIRGRDFRRP